MLLNNHLCHAWQPPLPTHYITKINSLLLRISQSLPTKREITFAVVGSIGTFALLRNYYLGQERRIKEAIHTENEATRTALHAENNLTQKVIIDQNLQTLTKVQNTEDTIVGALQETSDTLHEENRGIAEMILGIHYDLQKILRNQRLLLTQQNKECRLPSPLLLENTPSPSLYQKQTRTSYNYPVHFNSVASQISWPSTCRKLAGKSIWINGRYIIQSASGCHR